MQVCSFNVDALSTNKNNVIRVFILLYRPGRHCWA